MVYEVIRASSMRRDIRQLARYLRQEAGDRTARMCLAMLEYELEVVIADSPNTFSWFHETGKPYRAKLFKLGRTTFWIIYSIDDARQRVEVKRLWNSARKPDTHGL